MTIHNRSNGQPRTIRCAIYTRKSTDEGLEKDFNSLDAQREAGEAYITSQRHEGWTCLLDQYNDGGFTGANTDRPDLQRLLADIEAGKVDAVVCYKVDRLSRSLLDFAKLLEIFDRYGVSFVSVTQSFNTNTSIGRLTLNMLLSFAQFEREVISERTRDKIAATRRKGKWSGGRPILGYDVVDTKLVVNETEAIRVRKIFELYLEQKALLATLAELNRLGWPTKQWTTKRGRGVGGAPFDKGNLYNLLINPAYVGKVRYKTEVHPGEHPGIVDPGVFDQVQALLRRNHHAGGAEVRNRFGALLKGLLRCVPCQSGMTHSHSQRGTKRYRYYVCVNSQKRGRAACPSGPIPAAEMESFVIDQIRAMGRDPELAAATLAQARALREHTLRELAQEQDALERDLARWDQDVRRVAVGGPGGEIVPPRLAELQDCIRIADERLSTIREELIATRESALDEHDLRQALASFDPVWDNLSLREQARLVQLLVERVEYDGRSGDVGIVFHPTEIRTLAQELEQVQEIVA